MNSAIRLTYFQNRYVLIFNEVEIENQLSVTGTALSKQPIW